MSKPSSQNILITGASSGIGAEFARQFHALGNRVLLVARREEKLKELVNMFNAVRKDSAHYFALDLTDLENQVSELKQYINTHHIDILINNAGFGSFGQFERLDLEKECEMVRLNILSPIILTHSVLPQMKKRHSGAIINVSSVAGFQPISYMATYAATKAFELSHSLALRYEVKRYGIKVLAVCPGPTDTEFSGVARVPGTATGFKRDSVEMVARESIKALEKNYAWIVPGHQSYFTTLVCRILPKTFTTWVTEKILVSTLKKVHSYER